MKQTMNIHWWKALVLPALTLSGCQFSGRSTDKDDHVVDPPNTTLSRMGSRAPYENGYMILEVNGNGRGIRTSSSEAKKLTTLDSKLSERTKWLLRTMYYTDSDLSSAVHSCMVKSLEDGWPIEEKGGEALTQAANSYNSYLKELFSWIEEVGNSNRYYKEESNKWLMAKDAYTLPDGTIRCWVPLGKIDRLGDEVLESSFPKNSIDLVKILRENSLLQQDVKDAIENMLGYSNRARQMLGHFAKSHPEFDDTLQKVINDGTLTPKLQYLEHVIGRASIHYNKRNNEFGNFLADLGLKAILNEKDLERVTGIAKSIDFISKLYDFCSLEEDELRPIFRDLCSLPPEEFVYITIADHAIENFGLFTSDTNQETFNNKIMPLVEKLRSLSDWSNPNAEVLFDTTRRRFMPYEKWPRNVQILASDGIAYCDWKIAEETIKNMSDDLFHMRTDAQASPVTLLEFYKKSSPNILEAATDIKNLRAVVSNGFKDIDFSDRQSKIDSDRRPLRVLLVPGRDFRSKNGDEPRREEFQELFTTLGIALERPQIVSDVDLLFAPTKRGLFEALEGIGTLPSFDFFLDGQDKREDLLVIFIGLGYTGPKLREADNVGEMFDGSIILDRRSELEEASLKEVSHKISHRFRKITFLMITDAAASFVK